MKNPLAGLKNRFSEVKGRTLLLVITIVAVFIIAAVFSFRKNEAQILSGATSQNPRTATVKAPTNISSTPVGDVNNPDYVALQQQANARNAEQAIQKGTSSVATVTGNQFVSELSIPEPGIASIGGAKTTPAAQQEQVAAYQRVYEEQMARERERELQQQQEQATQEEAQYREAYEGLMQAQMKALMGQWKSPTQSYVRNAAEGEFGEKPAVTPLVAPMYKAGDIIFGVMETSVNSDEPGPVMAKVVSGPLAGSKVVGSFRRVEDQVIIEFTLLNAPDVIQSLPVKAVAIDPETARTALATDVDYHRLLRYSTLFGAAFLQGMGDAVLASIQPDFQLENDVFTVNSVTVGTRDQVIVGLGEVGRKAGEKMDKVFDMPPTVTVDSGTAVGLLFLQDFSLQPGQNPNPVQVIHTNAPPTTTGYVPMQSSTTAGISSQPTSVTTSTSSQSTTNTVNTQ